ncbi:hypothetical protein F5888DRAFT_941720 [Russula emetica]|nr:hypothetical protein F5888DRAFT_941720 [Russula emetica]
MVLRAPFTLCRSFPEDVPHTEMNPNTKIGLCSLLSGALLSTFLSGMCSLQAFLYVKQYPKDPAHLKALAFLVWSMDTVQLCCIVSLSFQYTILHPTNPDIVDHVFMHVS